MMKKIFVLLLVAFAATAQSNFEKKTFETKDGQVLPYQILLPKDYKPGKNILWLLSCMVQGSVGRIMRPN